MKDKIKSEIFTLFLVALFFLSFPCGEESTTIPKFPPTATTIFQDYGDGFCYGYDQFCKMPDSPNPSNATVSASGTESTFTSTTTLPPDFRGIS